ncbi:MAG: MarC family protein [Thermoproteota archaeon]|nr:MarC family protein [Candidatus Brockarchaeota archaeon]
MNIGIDLAVELERFTKAFILLFAILDSVGNVPVFHAFLESAPKEKRRKIISESVIAATGVLIFFALLGSTMFSFLGIRLSDFYIASGIVLVAISLKYIIVGEESEVREERFEEISVFPLATPLLAGPGSISTVIIISNPPYNVFTCILVIILNAVLAYVILLNGDRIMASIGRTPSKLIAKIFNLIIVAFGIVMIRNGLESLNL